MAKSISGQKCPQNPVWCWICALEAMVYKRVAVIGASLSRLSAVNVLLGANTFNNINSSREGVQFVVSSISASTTNKSYNANYYPRFMTSSLMYLHRPFKSAQLRKFLLQNHRPSRLQLEKTLVLGQGSISHWTSMLESRKSRSLPAKALPTISTRSCPTSMTISMY